jgi:iron complex outermembrane receptor protein
MRPIRQVALALLLGSPMMLRAQSVAPAPEAGDGPVLQEVVVTARRREENLQEVPVAVTALSAESLAAAGVVNTSDLTQAVPGLTFSRRNQSFQPVIRGIGTSGATAGDESSVGVYIDGVYQPETYADSFDVLKVDRVEVLRGPQGTLFGRNTDGGLVNVVTPDPTQTPQLDAELRYGRFDERSLQVYASTGLAPDLAMDIAFKGYQDDGYIADLFRGGELGAKKSAAVRSKLLFTPTDKARVTLAWNYSDTHDNSAVAVAPLNGNAVGLSSLPAALVPTKPWQSALNTYPVLNTQQWGVYLKSEWQFEPFTFETTSSGQWNRLNVVNDFDGTALNLVSATVNGPSDWATQELRLVSRASDRFQWTTGVFGIYGEDGYSPLILFLPAPSAPYTQTSHEWIRSWALFAEGSYNFTDAVRLTVGTRYTFEDRTFTAIADGATVVDGARTSYDAMTPRAALQYIFNDKANVYASWSRGTKSGVFNTQGTSPVPVAPETVDSTEIGLKLDPTRWLRANFAIFHYTYDNLQVTARNAATGLSYLQNAARASANGGEFEVSAAATSDLTVRLNGTYLRAVYDSFPQAQVYVPVPGGGNATVYQNDAGNDIERAPRYTVGLNLDYHHTFEQGLLGLSANYFKSAKYFWDSSERLYQPTYDKLNAELSWTLNNHLRFALWGENLTNAVVYTQILESSLLDQVGFERPRTYGVSFSWKL